MSVLNCRRLETMGINLWILVLAVLEASRLVGCSPVYNSTNVNSDVSDSTTFSSEEETPRVVATTVASQQHRNSDAFLSEKAINDFKFVSKFFIIPVICTFGIVSNSLGIGVLWQDTKQQKLSIYFYLLALTLADLLYLTIGLLRTIPEIMMSFEIETAKYIDAHAKPTVIYLDMVFSHTASAMIIVMSIERLLALIRPLTVRNTWFGKYPTQIVLICVMFNILFLLPYPIGFEVVSTETGNTTDYSLRFKKEANNSMKTFMTVQRIVDNFLPMIVLISTNVAIPAKYYHISKRRLADLNMVTRGQFGSVQAKITSTVLAVTIMYMLLQIPMLISLLLPYLDVEYSFDGEKRLVFWFFVDLGNLFSYINAANDFLIYILVSSHYRSVFKAKYCGCLGRGNIYMRDSDLSVTGQTVGSWSTVGTQDITVHF